MNIVVIDGIEYVPKTSIVSQKSLDALAAAYGIAFCWGVYDPDSRPEFLRQVWDHLLVVNEELHFQR